MDNISCRIIGPFLGPRGKAGVEIFIALPDHQITSLTCKVFKNNNEIAGQSCCVDESDIYKLFNFEFKELEDNEVYHYKFFVNGEPLELEGGLTEQDCNFRVLGENSENKSFILMSCHNPFKTKKGSADDGWAVWEQLSHHLKKDDSVRLLVLGGDQLYNDQIEEDYIKGENELDADTQEQIKKRFVEQYQAYWGDLNYRKVLASTLSVAMWDDHDITDGWGSRPESFDDKEVTGFKKNWWKYFEIASGFFKNYQASRNPKPIYKFSSILDWGDKRFVLADFRSERNSKKSQIWTKEHKNKVLQQLENKSDQIKQIFFVSPVVALRTNFSGDRRVSFLSKSLFKLRRHIEKNKPWYIIQNWKRYCVASFVFFLSPLLVSIINCNQLIKAFISHCYQVLSPLLVSIISCNICEKLPSGIFSILYLTFAVALPVIGSFLLLWVVISRLPHIMSKIPELPDLSDDMEDGLSSDSNMKSLKEILECLTNLAREGKEAYILSGDIHIGGLTEVIDTRESSEIQILQIVSSPIAYEPMPKVVAGLTTTSSEMTIKELNDDRRLFARNIFYLSKRNYVQVFSDRKEKSIAFHFEGHRFPTVFPKKFF